ncbi:hypothetical protein [Carboxydocella sp. ULO1]|uniref:hypothetical protein n=1 Tax=Carboxydocella sp. ULO1 TaxID=1926599 RepID=UPI001177C5D9|nr:hypothetical protein [Carboxydocella sp. ULO1]
MKKKKRKNEMAEIEDLPLDWEFPFEGQKKETYYNYHCQKCGYKEEVPAFIVDEMKAMDNWITWAQFWNEKTRVSCWSFT